MSSAEPQPSSRALRGLGWLGVAVAVAFGVWVRVDTGLRIPDFASPAVEGLLKSDWMRLYEVESLAGGGPSRR